MAWSLKDTLDSVMDYEETEKLNNQVAAEPEKGKSEGNGETAYFTMPDATKKNGTVTLNSGELQKREEGGSTSQTRTEKDYINVLPMDKWQKEYNRPSWEEVRDAYATKPDPEEARRKQNRQNIIAMSKAGAAGISQLFDLIYQPKGSSIRSKNYDLGEGNLQEAKKEEALHLAKMQDYFKRGEEYNRALQKDYADYAKNMAGTISTTYNSGKDVVTQKYGQNQQQEKKGTTNTGGKDGVVKSTFSYFTKGGNDVKNTEFWYDTKNKNVLPAVYGVLYEHRKYISDLQKYYGIEDGKNYFTKIIPAFSFEDKTTDASNTVSEAIMNTYPLLYSRYKELESKNKNDEEINEFEKLNIIFKRIEGYKFHSK